MNKLVVVMFMICTALSAKNIDAVESLAFKWLQQAESFSSTTYEDGEGILAIGYGFTDPELTMEGVISREKADKILKAKVVDINSWLMRRGVKLSRCKQVAIISFVYNVGKWGFSHSVLETVILKGGPRWMIESEIRRWNHSSGKVVKGLTRRRELEIELFRRPD